MKTFEGLHRHPGNSYHCASRDEYDEEVKSDEEERLPAELTRWKPFGMLSFAKPDPPTRSLSLNKHTTHNLKNFLAKRQIDRESICDMILMPHSLQEDLEHTTHLT